MASPLTTFTSSGLQASDKIFVAGHRGLVGSALVRRLAATGHSNVVTRARAELDLTDGSAVRAFFETERPRHVFLAAARVGGIHANNTLPGEFIRDNLAIQTNVIHEAWRAGVKHLLFLGSSCIYPRECPQPIKEEYLLTGPLEATNRPYAVAKIAGIEMCWAYNRQFGTQYVAAMPTNCYGPNDNYDLEMSHVLPALIRKFHEAKVRGEGKVDIWGTGAPRREFLYSEDLAEACIKLMNLSEQEYSRLFPAGVAPLVNVGCGEDRTIRELAELVAETCGYHGECSFDVRKPDGTPRKLLDIAKISSTGWAPRVALTEGLELAYQDFLTRYAPPEKGRN